MKNRSTWIVSIALIAVLGFTTTAYFIKQSKADTAEQKAVTNDFIMDTFVTQQVYGKNGQAAADEVVEKLLKFEQKYSMYNEVSEIYQLNENAGKKAIVLSSDVFSFLQRAVDLSKSSNGVFDITIAPLTKLWGITSGNTTVPDETDIAKAMSVIEIDSLVLDEATQTAMLQKGGQAVDLGGIAKGYSCMLAKEIYEKYGVQGALLSIGGNLYAYKTKPDGSSFKIGIRDPRGEDSAYFASIEIKDQVVATSGDYERYFEVDGIRYHHILDPNTGYPAQTDLISVTIISDDGALSDFLSTTLFIQGKAALSEYRNSTEFDFVAVDSEFNIYISENIKESVTLYNQNGKYKLIWN